MVELGNSWVHILVCGRQAIGQICNLLNIKAYAAIIFGQAYMSQLSLSSSSKQSLAGRPPQWAGCPILFIKAGL